MKYIFNLILFLVFTTGVVYSQDIVTRYHTAGYSPYLDKFSSDRLTSDQQNKLSALVKRALDDGLVKVDYEASTGKLVSVMFLREPLQKGLDATANFITEHPPLKKVIGGTVVVAGTVAEVYTVKQTIGEWAGCSIFQKSVYVGCDVALPLIVAVVAEMAFCSNSDGVEGSEVSFDDAANNPLNLLNVPPTRAEALLADEKVSTQTSLYIKTLETILDAAEKNKDAVATTTPTTVATTSTATTNTTASTTSAAVFSVVNHLSTTKNDGR